MAKKRICRICGYENNANISSCGMCGADFGLELNFEEVDTNYDENVQGSSVTNSGTPDSGSTSAGQPNTNSQSAQNADDSEWEPVFLKRMWSEGVSKFLSVVIVFIFLAGVTMYYFQTSEKMQKYRIVYQHMLEANDGDVGETIHQMLYLNSAAVYQYAEEYSRGDGQNTSSVDNNAEETQENKKPDNSKKKSSKNKQKNKKTKKSNSDYIFKNSDKRYLKDKELKKLSKKKLSIARNEIYARAGRRFTTKKWSNYFKKKVWYKPKYSAKYFDKHEKKLLNKYERANIKKIKKFEKK